MRNKKPFVKNRHLSMGLANLLPHRSGSATGQANFPTYFRGYFGIFKPMAEPQNRRLKMFAKHFRKFRYIEFARAHIQQLSKPILR